MDPARITELVDVNLRAPMLLARAALPVLRRPGALVFVTSIAGLVGVPGETVYSVTKAGLETFATLLREEVEGVTVSTVAPGRSTPASSTPAASRTRGASRGRSGPSRVADAVSRRSRPAAAPGRAALARVPGPAVRDRAQDLPGPGPPVRLSPALGEAGRDPRGLRTAQLSTPAARIDSRSEPIVASTAVGSYPQCAMQL